MSPTELGAYVRLLLKHYSIGLEGIPNNESQLARIAGLTLDKWRKISPVILEKFTTSGKNLIQHKACQVINSCLARSSSNRDKALKMHNSSHAKAEPQHQSGSAIHNTESIIQNTIKDLYIPDWVPKPEFENYVGVRISNSFDVSKSSLNSIISKLQMLEVQGHSPKEVLVDAAAGSWKNLRPPNNQPKGTYNANMDRNTATRDNASGQYPAHFSQAASRNGAIGSNSIHQGSLAASTYRKQVLAEAIERREKARESAGLDEKLDS